MTATVIATKEQLELVPLRMETIEPPAAAASGNCRIMNAPQESPTKPTCHLVRTFGTTILLPILLLLVLVTSCYYYDYYYQSQQQQQQQQQHNRDAHFSNNPPQLMTTTTTTTTLETPILRSPRQLYQLQESLKLYDWEWVLVRIDAVTNLPLESLGTDFPDPEFRIRVNNNNNNNNYTQSLSVLLPTDIPFSGDLTSFAWPILWNAQTNLTNIKRLGMAAYLKGTAESMDFIITEKNQVDQDYVIFHQYIRHLPDTDLDDWTRYSLHQRQDDVGNHIDDDENDDDDDHHRANRNGAIISVDLAMKRMTRPLFSERDQSDMGLVEHLILLENGELASLAHKIHKPQLHHCPNSNSKSCNNINKAVVYFAGRSDSFAHPHVLKMYQEAGYDFYTLDVRRSGRARRFLKNPHLGNDVVDFMEFVEDVELALEYMHRQKNYTQVVAHCHSNGALVLFAYLLHREKRRPKEGQQFRIPDFDGFILNSPFLAWGNVGGSLNEWLLKNAAMINYYFHPQELWGHAGSLNDWWTKIWILYRWNLAWKPVITNSLTSHYAEAVSNIHQQINDFEGYLLTDKPTLVMSSQSDDILQHSETLRLAAKLHPHPTLVEFDFSSHDVTQSMTRDLNDRAIKAMSDWLEDLITYRTLD